MADETSCKIVEIGKRLHSRNLLAACDGNISVRLEDRKVLITPTGKNKLILEPTDLALIDLENHVLKGTPSSEREMHLEVYRQCEKARAIVHAHPPTAIAWTLSHPELTELPCEAMSEVILAVGALPIAPYTRPTTKKMGEVLTPFLPHHRVILLSRHGALSWGESLEEAYDGMERLEHAAQILKSAYELGGIKPLPLAEVQALKEMRRMQGSRSL